MFQSAATKYVNPLSEYPYKFTTELTGKDVVEDDHVEFKIELDEEDGDVKWFKDGVEIIPDGKRVQVRVPPLKKQSRNSATSFPQVTRPFCSRT